MYILLLFFFTEISEGLQNIEQLRSGCMQNMVHLNCASSYQQPGYNCHSYYNT